MAELGQEAGLSDLDVCALGHHVICLPFYGRDRAYDQRPQSLQVVNFLISGHWQNQKWNPDFRVLVHWKLIGCFSSLEPICFFTVSENKIWSKTYADRHWSFFLNFTQNAHCALGDVRAHSGEQKRRSPKPTSEWSSPCYQHLVHTQSAAQSQEVSQSVVSDLITKRGLGGKAGILGSEHTRFPNPSAVGQGYLLIAAGGFHAGRCWPRQRH